MNFVVVRSPSPYNRIIGRPGVRKIQTVPSTAHEMLKFSFPRGILTLRSSKIIPLECMIVSGPKAQPSASTRVAKEKIKVAIHLEYLKQTIAIGSTLTEEGEKDQPKAAKKGEAFGKDKATVILMVQPWIIGRPGVRKIQTVPSTAHEMLKFSFPRGILTLRSSKIIPLKCMIVSGPKAQPSASTRVAKEKIKVAIHLEYLEQTIAIGSTLTEEGASVECSGRMPSSKTEEKEQALERNKAIQEEVKRLVETGIMKEVHYHIWLSNPNARATYQCLVDKAFHKQIGTNLEVYVDDLVIKSRTEQEIIRVIEETFKTLREINMKLNPKKYTFGVEEGMFLGYTEELIVYLAAAREAVSAFLMTEREAKQMPIYLISRALQGLKINYTPVEKLVLALVHASKRLKRYFQAHQMVVITDQPIKQVLSKNEKLQEDFTMEQPKDDPLIAPMEVEEELPDQWTLFIDGSSYIDGFGAGLILTDHEGTEFTYAVRFRFDATNNEAEYEALIADLRIAEQTGVKNLQTHVDSRLVANQINGSYIAKEPGMIQYLEKVKMLANSFKKFSIKQVSWHGTVNLTVLAFSYHFPYVFMHGWPVVSCSYNFGYYGHWSGVHATGTFVDFSYNIVCLQGSDTP
nr:reverse transcriptase domain-containing protein [Tanacetum cinerariifolium]